MSFMIGGKEGVSKGFLCWNQAVFGSMAGFLTRNKIDWSGLNLNPGSELERRIL
jgi:hypothetical protein